jgi:membrane protease YdiL (CAAX protease family)
MEKKENLPENQVQDFLEASSAKEVFKLIGTYFRFFLREKVGVVILSTILLLLLWGYHGNLDLLKVFIKSWEFPCESGCDRTPIISGIPWDRELISFLGGALLLVVMPVLIIRFYFKQPLGNYGLLLPPKGKRKAGVIIFLVFMAITSVSMYVAAGNQDMQALYPFYKTFTGIPQFMLYELCYFPFFLVIEFVFRGYLLFGVADNPITATSNNTTSNTVYLRAYAIIISMLAYNTWHLGKPLTELWSTPIWGFVAGVVTYTLRSIWPVLIVHFLMNVLLDAFILHHLKLLF